MLQTNCEMAWNGPCDFKDMWLPIQIAAVMLISLNKHIIL